MADPSPPSPQQRSQPVPAGVQAAAADALHDLQLALAAAFQEDPVFGWLLPRAAMRPRRLRAFFALELRHVLKRGSVWTSDERAGAALALPPGSWRTPPHVAMPQGRPFGLRLMHAAGLLGTMEWRHLRAPHWYFAYIGVAPEAQGRGLGSSLMRPTLDRCDADRLPAYLEASSERNAALYERLGFRVTRELRFAGSPPLRLMVRAPQPPGA